MRRNKLLFLITIFLFSCQDKKNEEASQFTGKWKLIEMGKYLVAGKCEGEIDDEEYRGLKSMGFTLTLEFKNDGTGTETTTGPDARTETFSWTEIGETICIKNSCAPFEMAANQLSFRVNFQEEAYCEDEDFNITGDDNKRACESASTSNTWVPAQCNTERYRKEMD